MSTPGASGIWCRGCGYALSGVSGTRCPECGRSYEPGDPRTWDRSRWSRFRRRCGRAAIVMVAAVLVLAAVAPMGYAVGRARLTTRDGVIDREVVRVELMPSLLGVSLGGWDRTVLHAGPAPGSGDGVLARRPHRVSADARAFRWGVPPFRPLQRPYGSMSGSTGGDEKTVGFINHNDATLSTLAAIAGDLSGQMVRSGSYGILTGAREIGEPIPEFVPEGTTDPGPPSPP